MELITCAQRVRIYGKDLRQRLVKMPVVKFPYKLGESGRYVPLFVLG
jgi:hypothetical protein